MIKRQPFFSFMIFLMIAFTCNAQTLKRTVLYTLAQNEKMVYEIGQNRFIVEPSENGYKFATIIENKKDNQNSLLIFNGKKFPIIQQQEPYLDIQKTNGYGFSFIKNNQTYINLADTIFGPYEEAGVTINNDEVWFSYQLLGKWFEYHKGNIFERIDSNKIKNNYAYSFVKSNENSDYYVNIKGYLFGPFYNNNEGDGNSSEPIFELYKNGRYWLQYFDKQGAFININNEKFFGPYVNRPYFSYAEDGGFLIGYQIDSGEKFININDSINIPVDDIQDVCITKKNNFGYYFARNESGTDGADNYYVNINNNKYGPFSLYPKFRIKLLDNGVFAFDFVQKSNVIKSGEDKYYYININGSEFGPYDNISEFDVSENGNYLFGFIKDNETFININGNVKKTEALYDGHINIENTQIDSKNNYCFKYRINNHLELIRINDFIYGPYSVDYGFSYSQYDELSNVILFENGDFSYSYIKNGAQFINRNGTNIKLTNVFESYGVFGGYSPEISVISDDNKHLLMYNEEPEEKGVAFKYNYVVVDGKKYGKALPVTASWYEERKSFIWSSIEGKDLVVYELTYDNEFSEYKTLKNKSDSMIYLGDISYNDKDYYSALNQYISAKEILKTDISLFKIKNTQKAIKNAKKQTSIINGDKYFANKQFKEALVEYKLANEFEQSNDVTDKIKTTQEAIEKRNKYDSIITNGDTYFNQKKYKLAILEYNKASVVDNNSDINIKLRSCDAEISKIDSLQKLRIQLFTYIRMENDSINNQRGILKSQLLDKKRIYGQNYDSCMTFLSLNFTNRLSSITKLFDPNNREIIDTWNEPDQKSLEELFKYKEEFEKYKMFHKTIKFAFETENKEKLKLLKSSENPSEIINKIN